MERKNVQRIALGLTLILIVMIVNDFSLHLVEALNIETYHPFYHFFWIILGNSEFYTAFWLVHWGVASFLIIFLSFLIKTDFLDKWSKQIEKETPEDGEEIKHNWDDDEIMNCKIALLKQYLSLSNGQGVRIIGLIAGLWTLLTIIEPLGEGEFLLRIPAGIITSAILFFIFRSFFRFTVYSAYSSHVRWIEKPELRHLLKIDETLEGKNLLVLLELATLKKIIGELKDFDSSYTRQRIWGIPYDYFMEKNKFGGFVLCGTLAILSAIVLLTIVW